MKVKILILDIFHFALTQKTRSQRLLYIFRGLIFLPFLLEGASTSKEKEQDTVANPSGDDIYPLF